MLLLEKPKLQRIITKVGGSEYDNQNQLKTSAKLKSWSKYKNSGKYPPIECSSLMVILQYFSNLANQILGSTNSVQFTLSHQLLFSSLGLWVLQEH